MNKLPQHYPVQPYCQIFHKWNDAQLDYHLDTYISNCTVLLIPTSLFLAVIGQHIQRNVGGSNVFVCIVYIDK